MQQQDDVPLTPMVVDCVTFDRAPLGRRGYNEDQVDDFLDRVHATLSGTDDLSAQEVRDVIFDSAPLIRRGYHEEQVDDFLDLVVEEFERREREGVHLSPPQSPPAGFTQPPAPNGAPRQTGGPADSPAAHTGPAQRGPNGNPAPHAGPAQVGGPAQPGPNGSPRPGHVDSPAPHGGPAQPGAGDGPAWTGPAG